MFNFSDTPEAAKVYSFRDLLNLNETNLCDESDPTLPDSLNGKFVLGHYFTTSENASHSEVQTNCSITRRAQILSVRLFNAELSSP